MVSIAAVGARSTPLSHQRRDSRIRSERGVQFRRFYQTVSRFADDRPSRLGSIVALFLDYISIVFHFLATTYIQCMLIAGLLPTKDE